MKRIGLIFALAAAPLAALAQEKGKGGENRDAKSWQPSIGENAKDVGRAPITEAHRPPPRIDPLPGPNLPLSPKEPHGVRYGKEWANNRDVPARGEDGSIVFVFGSTLPTVVCAPLYVCDLALQAGESVNDLNVGDGVRWQITPATQGAGEHLTTHVMIKPTDVGLLTNLVITTDRRAYTIKLVSQRTARLLPPNRRGPIGSGLGCRGHGENSHETVCWIGRLAERDRGVRDR